VTEVESIVEPDSVADDVRRESVAFVCIHCLIVPILVFNLAIPATVLIINAVKNTREK
jgi:hypothetical protein